MRLYEKVPPPFVLHVLEGGGTVRAGDDLLIRLKLIGDAARLAPFAVRAFEEAGERGFGSGRLAYSLSEVADPHGRPARDPQGRLTLAARRVVTPPAPQDVIGIRLLTPLRLQREGKTVRPGEFSLAIFLMSIVRRINLLAQFYDQPLQSDFKLLKDLAHKAVLSECRLAWKDIRRHSSRQGQYLYVGGLTGSFALDIRGAEELWPYLHLATLIGAGKATTMGLGMIGLDNVA